MITSSVCIITKNRPQFLQECLASICKQTQLPEEVIIVENNLKKNLTAIIASYSSLNIVYELEKHPNIALARNRALSLATKECIVLLDDDCIPKNNWLSEIIKDFDNHLVVASVGKYENYESDSLIAETEQLMFEKWFSQFFHLHRKSTLNSGEFINSRNLALRKSFLSRTNISFNTDAPYKIEDTDFGIRLFQIKLNREVVFYNPKAILLHRNSRSLTSFFLRRYHAGKGKYFLNKSYSNWETGIVQNSHSVFLRQSTFIRLLLWLERQFFRTGYFIEKSKNAIFKNPTELASHIPIKSKALFDDEVEIQMLLCQADVNNLQFTLSQLFNLLNYQIPIRIYPDHSVSSADLDSIRKLYRRVSITEENKALSHLEPWLKNKKHFCKRFASFQCSRAKRLIFLDPDVVFLKKPQLVDKWIKFEIAQNYYLKDVGDYYSYSNLESQMITNRELAKAVNVGLVLFHRPKDDLVVNESIHESIKTIKTVQKQRVIGGWNEYPYWYLDQTIWANLLQKTKAKTFPDSYTVYAELEWKKGNLNRNMTAIHFSGPFKKHLSLYQKEISKKYSTYFE